MKRIIILLELGLFLMSISLFSQSYLMNNCLNEPLFKVCSVNQTLNYEKNNAPILKIKKDENSNQINGEHKIPFALGEISKNDERWQRGGIYYGFTPEQEIIEKRTKVAKHFQLPNGEYAAFIGSIKHYKDDNGAWQDIDLTIKNNNTNKHNEYKYCNTTNNVKTYFPEASDSLGIIVEYEDLQLSFWVNPKIEILNSNYESISSIKANIAKGVCNGNVIQYEDFAGIIDEFVIQENGIKNNIILNNNNWIVNANNEKDYASFQQFIPLNNDYKVYKDDKIVLSNFVAESFVIKRLEDSVGFIFSPIIIYDNGINKERVYRLITIPEEKITNEEQAELDAHVLQVKYKVEFVDNGIRVSVIIPIKWLKENSRTYPVVIDPSVTIGTGTSTQRQPWGIWWGYERSAAIYLSSEIRTTGINITSVKWNVSTTQDSIVPYILRLNTTSSSTLSTDTWDNIISGATQVSSGTKLFSSTGWDGFTGIGYNYPSNNLLVLCKSNYTGDGTSSYPYFYCTSTSDNKHEYWYQDNSAPTGTGTVSTNRPDIYIEYVSLRPCDQCTPADANLGTIGTNNWGYSITGNCGNGGKWVASFTGEAGYTYWFDLCNIGTGNFDADIKICDASCNILTGVDGYSSCGWRPNQFSWNCPSNGTYYVIIAPYSSYSSHNCNESSANTFTMYYYKGLDYCGVVDHGGNDLTISSNMSVGGEHINIGTFTINSGVTVTVNSSCHYFYVSANDIVMNGTINADGAGETGGNGGNGGAQAYGDDDGCNGGYGGIGGLAGSGSGGGSVGGSGGNGSCRKQKCGGFLCSGNRDGFMGGGGGAGGGGGGGYGGTGGYGGFGGKGASWNEASGGSYGSGGNAGVAYGTPTGTDINWGSGGGGAGGGGGAFDNGTNGGRGGNGGGAIKLIASNNCTVTGTISSNGSSGAAGGNGGQTSVTQGYSCSATGYNSCSICSQANYDAAGGAGGGAGGGSGGGILIQASGIMTFTGSINASGGNGGPAGVPDKNYGNCHDYAKGGAGGGGGRVKIFVNPCLNHNISGTISVSGGNGGSGYSTGNSGSNGTSNVINLSMPYPTFTASASPSSICIGGSSTLSASGANNYTWSHSLGSGSSKTVAPTSTTTYSVTGTNQYGCTGTATVSVTVNPLPTVTASASPAAICNGASSTLTAGGASTYTWSHSLGSGASKTVTPTSTTTYSVTGTNNYGCTGGNTVSVTVLPPINYGSVASGNETICYSGDPANITMSVSPSGSGSFTYQWYYQDGIVSCPSGSSTSGWTAIPGANSSSYNPPSGLTDSRTYAVFITPSGTPTCGTSQWASGCRQVTVIGYMKWTGNAGDGNWHNTANWCGIVPTSALDALIPNGCSTYPNNYSSSTASCKTLTIESAASVSIANNITLDCEEDVINNGTLTMIGNSTLKCGRHWNNINGTFNAGNGTVVFDSNDGTISTGGNGASKKFYNVECNAAGKVKTLNGAIDCDNNFTITAGTWSAGGNSMNIAGNWTNNGIFTHGNNTVTFDGSANQTIKAGASPFYEVIINNSGNPITYNVSILSNMDIADTLKIKKGLFLINGGYSLKMTNSSIPSSTNVYIIDIYSGGILKLDNSSSQITRQDVDADIRVQQGGELNINAGTLTGFDYHQIEGNFNMTGGKLTTHNAGDKGRIIFTGTASGSQTAGIIEFNSLLQAMSNTSWYASGGLIRTIGSSDGSINVSEHNFYINNLEIYGNTNKNVRQTSNVSTGSIPDLDIRGYLKIYSSITLNSNNKDITIAGNWTNDGTYSYGSTGNTVIFNGNLDQTISGNNSTTFYNLNIDKTITKLILDVNNTTVKNNLTLTNGAIELNQKTLIIDNSSPAAINRINGYILSNTLDKNFNSKVQWNIGTTATGEYIFPFGISDTYIPFKFKVTTAGVGNLSVSTYPTGGTDASGVYSNKPNIVTNLNSPLYPDPPAPGNAINIVRRFWYINKSGGSGIADLTFSWAASEDPLSGAINTMIAQRYLEQINKWEYPPLDAQSSSILNTPRYVTVPNVINFSPWAITRNDHPLPISLLYFNGDCKDSIVVLNWATASEINNDYFTIEYTNNLNDEPVVWTPICTIDGAGNSNTIKTYQYIDKPYKRDNSSNVIFYRLKQTDFNGSFTYSNTIDIHCLNAQDNDIEIINAYCEQQNSCNIVNVLFRMPGDKDYTIKLYNIYGQLIAKTSGISKDGYNQTQIYLNDILDQAIYVVILLNNENIKTKKVLLY